MILPNWPKALLSAGSSPVVQPPAYTVQFVPEDWPNTWGVVFVWCMVQIYGVWCSYLVMVQLWHGSGPTSS